MPLEVVPIEQDENKQRSHTYKGVVWRGKRKIITSQDLRNITDAELQEEINNTSIFARITPEDKLKIVRAAQKRGHIIAVTGDGINDAPALSEANIGVAMGGTGTDVAREAADMILTDDNFSTIAFAVKGGRKIYDNLRKGVRYYLAVKMGLILIFLPYPPFILWLASARAMWL